MSDGPPVCECGTEKEWQECETCGGEGLDGHDCGDDCCCCADPEEANMPCSICFAAGGWWFCWNCREKAARGTP